MAITINWGTRVIAIPKADMTLKQAGPPEIRELDLNTFRQALKDSEDSDEGMAFPDTHIHNTEQTLSGIVYARMIKIINGYTVTFENGQYVVTTVGANSNIADVKNPNQVSLVTNNSAGLQIVSQGSGLSQEEHDAVMEVQTLKSYVRNKKALVKVGSVWHFRIYALDGSTPIIDKELKDKDGLDITDLLTGIQAQEAASIV